MLIFVFVEQLLVTKLVLVRMNICIHSVDAGIDLNDIVLSYLLSRKAYLLPVFPFFSRMFRRKYVRCQHQQSYRCQRRYHFQRQYEYP